MQLVDHRVELPELSPESIFEDVNTDIEKGEEWVCTPTLSISKRPTTPRRHVKRGKIAFIVQMDDTPTGPLGGITKVCISAIKAEPNAETEAMLKAVLKRIKVHTDLHLTVFREAGMLGYYINYLD